MGVAVGSVTHEAIPPETLNSDCWQVQEEKEKVKEE